MCAMYKANSTSFKEGNVPWNKGKPLPKWFRNRLSQARLNSDKVRDHNHFKWTGGSRSYYKKFAEKMMASTKKLCVSCQSNEKLHIHHIDRNYKNNESENLIFLCASCHLKLHHREDKKDCVCLRCSKEFQSGRKPAQFCSSTCRVQAWKTKKYGAK